MSEFERIKATQWPIQFTPTTFDPNGTQPLAGSLLWPRPNPTLTAGPLLLKTLGVNLATLQPQTPTITVSTIPMAEPEAHGLRLLVFGTFCD